MFDEWAPADRAAVVSLLFTAGAVSLVLALLVIESYLGRKK